MRLLRHAWLRIGELMAEVDLDRVRNLLSVVDTVRAIEIRGPCLGSVACPYIPVISPEK